MPESSERGALTEAVFFILLALYKPMHGYGIMQFVAEVSKGRVVLGAGTLYGAINTLLEKQWIAAYSHDISNRKKEYIITSAGKQMVGTELLRLQELIVIGKSIIERGDDNV